MRCRRAHAFAPDSSRAGVAATLTSDTRRTGHRVDGRRGACAARHLDHAAGRARSPAPVCCPASTRACSAHRRPARRPRAVRTRPHPGSSEGHQPDRDRSWREAQARRSASCSPRAPCVLLKEVSIRVACGRVPRMAVPTSGHGEGVSRSACVRALPAGVVPSVAAPNPLVPDRPTSPSGSSIARASPARAPCARSVGGCRDAITHRLHRRWLHTQVWSTASTTSGPQLLDVVAPLSLIGERVDELVGDWRSRCRVPVHASARGPTVAGRSSASPSRE